MARLTSRARKALPSKDFAGPGRSYPIENKSHARDALARASEFASPAEQATIREKVERKFPAMKVKGKAPRKRRSRGGMSHDDFHRLGNDGSFD